MGTGEFGMLIFSTISIIILSCMGIYGFKEGKSGPKKINGIYMLLEVYPLLECFASSV